MQEHDSNEDLFLAIDDLLDEERRALLRGDTERVRRLLSDVSAHRTDLGV